jgi:Holliday junction resolvase-like predicted endonuclease
MKDRQTKEASKDYSKQNRKQALGVSGETRVLLHALKRGERYIASRFRLGRFGEIDLITMSKNMGIYCYEVRTSSIAPKSRYYTDQFPQRKRRKLMATAKMFEMYHVKRFIGCGTGVYVQDSPKRVTHQSRRIVKPILASVTGETSATGGIVWDIQYFDINGNELTESDLL